MNRSKKLYALLGFLIVICLVTFGVSNYEEQKEQIKNKEEVILEIPSEDVTSLSWEYESEKLAFHKEENWLYDEDEAFPVDEEKIMKLLEQFQEFGVSFIIEDVKDYGQYGLNSPSCTIHIETSDEQFEILLGDYSDMDSERYISIGDGNVYLVKDDPMDDFEIKLSDLILHDEVPKFDGAEEIQFAGTENYHIVHQENSDMAYSEEDVYFVKKENDYQPLDTDHVEDYLQAVKDTTLENYVTYNASDGDLATYGLEDPDLEITVQYTIQNDEEQETGSFAFSIARDPKEKEKTEKSSDEEPEKSEEITAYARVGDSRIIYKITGEDYKTLMSASYDELRHQKVLPVAFEDIYQVDISLEGKNYTLSADKKKKKTVWSYKDEELKIDKFKRALMALKASDFEVDRPEGKEEISLTLHLENENYPEFRVDLYRDDGSLCIAVVNGEPVSHVKRSYVVDLVEAVHAIVLD